MQRKNGKKKRKCHLIFSISGVRTHHNDLKWSRFQKKTLDYHQTFKKGGNWAGRAQVVGARAEGTVVPVLASRESEDRGKEIGKRRCGESGLASGGAPEARRERRSRQNREREEIARRHCIEFRGERKYWKWEDGERESNEFVWHSME
jgi:hypothetical protein